MIQDVLANCGRSQGALSVRCRFKIEYSELAVTELK